MQNKPITDQSGKRKKQAITLSSFLKLDSTTNNGTVQIDPQILFQRLMLITAYENLNTEDVFICTYTTALFNSPGVPRLAKKATVQTLCEIIFKSLHKDQYQIHSRYSMVEPYYTAYHGPEMYLFKRYVMATGVTCAASMENVLSYLMATLMAQPWRTWLTREDGNYLCWCLLWKKHTTNSK